MLSRLARRSARVEARRRATAVTATRGGRGRALCSSPSHASPPSVLVAGLDEAGRGAVLGPMTVALVAVTRSSEQRLLELGVKDSKALTPARRAELAVAVREHADMVELVSVDAEDIDRRRAAGENLNQIEFASMAELLRRAGAGRGRVKAAVVDSYETKAEKLQARMGEEFPDLRVVAETKADAKYVAVAAASIVAKHARDEAVGRMQERMEPTPIGSGYPSDPKTKAYLDRRGGNGEPVETPAGEESVPRSFVRRSWRLQTGAAGGWGARKKKVAKAAAAEGDGAAAAARPPPPAAAAKKERKPRTKKPPPKMSWSIIIE